MQLVVRGKVATLTLSGYKTEYAHSAGEYNPSKSEGAIPSGYRPYNQAYGMLGNNGGLLVTGGGQVVFQPVQSYSAGTSFYGGVSYTIA